MAFNTLRATVGAPVAAPSSGIIGSIKAALVRLEERSRIYFELSQMSSRELADLGVARSEIAHVARGTFRRS